MTTGSAGAGAGYGGMASSAIGAVSNAYAAYASAKGAKQNLEFAAKMGEYDARMMELRAADRQAVGNEQLFRLKLTQKQHYGASRARTFAHGGDATGSHLAILQDAKWVANLEQQTLISNTDKEVFAIKHGALSRAFSADMSRIKAGQISPTAAAVPGLISGAGDFASSWRRLNPYTTERAESTFGRDSQDSHGAEYE